MSLDSIVGVVAGKISELLIEEAKLLHDVEDEVTSLKDELMMMTGYLQDMEEEGHDERSRVIIKQIRKLAYDAEDLIESYILEVGFSDSKKGGFMERYVCFCGSVSRTHTLASDITALKKRINETMERWKKYLGEIGKRIEGRDQGMKRTRFRAPITFPNSYEEYVVGLEEDINKLVGVLTTDETQVKMVSIVGMGGSGKTTLARKLYNHESVKTHFDCLAWVSVSEEWVAKEILLNLLKKASGQTVRTDEAPTLQEVVERLQQYLESKRYLIVLDDVWKKQALEQILPTLPFANACRKIIVTTRKREVIDFPDLKCFNHDPRRLSEEESWELFRRIALIHKEESSNSTNMTLLEALGKEMLKKCAGLPLAVIALAGILGKKETIEEWEKVKKAVSSRIMEDGRGTHLYGPVNEMLGLSYNDLPCEIRPCFLYLANFPEDCEIYAEHLIKMWIAEGFIMSDKLHEGDQTLEDVAEGYLDELIHRCVVQIVSKDFDGKVELIRMHDLVRDLCIKKAEEQDFAKIFTSGASNSNATTTESRRIAIYHSDGMDIRLTEKSQPLRSLIVDSSRMEYHPPHRDLQFICQNFRLLRILMLHGIVSFNSTLPSGIGSLIHLRYLSLRRTNITELPSSIGNLRKLQTLECSHLYTTMRIPDVFWKIEGLRHLDFAMAEPIDGKLKLDTLKSLQTLCGIEGGDWMLKELPLLSQTVQKLGINEITSQELLEAALECPSIKFDRLHSLFLEWVGVVVLKKLEPFINCQHLTELSLDGRIEDRLAGCDIQFPNCIKVLTLSGSGFEAEGKLAALGKLPSLISLSLLVDSYVGTKWTCFAGEFPQLKQLGVGGFPNLEEWSIERGAMPHLRRLMIDKCKKLRKLPEGLKFINGLQELTLSGMIDEFMKRVKEGVDGNGGGEDAHIIQHVPTVTGD